MTTMNGAVAPQRPGAVFVGSYLLAGMAAVALGTAIASFFAIPEFSYVQSKLEDNDEVGTLVALGLVAYALLAMVFGGLCLVLAVLDRRGNSVGRALTWVLGGLAVCFNSTLLITGVFDSVPWYRELTRIAALAIVLLAAGSVTLLALPVSHGYFRATRAARQRRQSQPGPPPGYRPPNHPTPPPGYQPPPRQQAQPPANPADRS